MKKPDSKTILGIGSGLGFLCAGAVKVYTFGWDDVSSFWIVAGVVGVMVIVFFAVWSRKREHREIRQRIERGPRVSGDVDAKAPD